MGRNQISAQPMMMKLEDFRLGMAYVNQLRYRFPFSRCHWRATLLALSSSCLVRRALSARLAKIRLNLVWQVLRH